jgi:outer membrane protein assembly factor BamE (lipoprotein component of BamABCDE complex)
MASRLVSFGLAMAGAALLGGCVGIKEHKGYVMDKEIASTVQVGVDNKASVEKTLGRPSFTGQFDTNDWYYISRDAKTIAFRSQKVLDHEVLHIRFDQAGNVASVNTTGKELVANISPNKDKTPTLGRQRSFFDEMFGNIGVLNNGALGQQQPRQ